MFIYIGVLQICSRFTGEHPLYTNLLEITLLHGCSSVFSMGVLMGVFILASNTYKQNTRFASHGLLTKLTCNTLKYGIKAFVASAISSRIFFRKEFPSNNLRQITYSQLKVLIKNYFFNSYNQIFV